MEQVFAIIQAALLLDGVLEVPIPIARCPNLGAGMREIELGESGIRLVRDEAGRLFPRTMDRIVLTKPLDLDTLSRIPGFATIKCERFGEGFVKTVQDVIEHFEEFRRASLLQKVKRGSYPRVKTLFMQNVTLPEIAQVCDILIGTVCGYLRDLHEANLVDLIPWIERNINSKSLYAGVEYFERVRQPNLKEAYNTLGLDYNTLLFCRLYAKDKRMQRAETRLMAS